MSSLLSRAIIHGGAATASDELFGTNFGEQIDGFIDDPLKTKEARRAAEAAARAQREAADRQSRNILEGLTRLREAYGIGDSTLARDNRSKLNRLLQDRERALVDQENQAVDQEYAQAVSQQRQAEVYGGGVHGQERARGRNLAGLIGGRQRARAIGRNATNQGNLALDQDLARQESQFLGRAQTPESYFDASNQHLALQAAADTVPQQTIGNAFNQAGQIVTTDANAKANDRRGIF